MRPFVALCLSVLMLTALLSGCTGRRTGAWTRLDTAESIIETHPDSALSILAAIDTSRLGGAEERARYALLMSMALDKNYIDTTTFAILQPAIDYYLEHGTPDDRLRTYYYQASIYRNRGEQENQMKAYTYALDLSNEITDSICLARILVSQSCLFEKVYNEQGEINNNLRAARIYHDQGKTDLEFDCLMNAFDDYILHNNKTASDSLFSICSDLASKVDGGRQIFLSYTLPYYTQYGTPEQFRDSLEVLTSIINLNTEESLDVARSWHELGEFNRAKSILDSISYRNLGESTLKYYGISFLINESLGNYKEALNSHKIYRETLDSIHNDIFSNKLQFSEDKHKLELKSEKERAAKNRIILICIGGIILLFLISILLYVIYRNIKISREKLSLKTQNLLLEKQKQEIEKENLYHRIADLEEERDKLKRLLINNNALSINAKNIIKERIEMLNTLLAARISDNEKYHKIYDDWLEDIVRDKKRFMDSTRLAYKASNPEFIKYLENHGLSESEINYICLYALGLKGKEIGKYIEKRGHFNMSSEIRKKLGLTEHETNLGIYIRRLLKSL